ncbi:MAG: phosphatase PAP2 family protein [Candidatus Falkowbacteria bacterium]
MDYYLFQQINGSAGQWAKLDYLGIFLASYLQYAIVGFLLVYLFLGKNKQEKFKNQLMVFGALIAALVARFVVATSLYYCFMRFRPFVNDIVNQLIPYDGARSSFPSGHASFFFALATVVYLYNKKLGAWLLAAAALISLARIYVGVHYPSDVLAGALIGLLVGWLVYYLLNRYQNKKAR